MLSDSYNQQPVWEDRAKNWDTWGFGEPLSPGRDDLNFQDHYVIPNGSTLVLGATQSLVELAVKKSHSATVVDFAPTAHRFCPASAEFICMDWIAYLKEGTEQYDTIVTDNGGTCLEYPSEWQDIARGIYLGLKPGGVFSSRFFVASENPPKETYDNQNLRRIMPAIGRVSLESNWMTIKPASANGERYPARYTFPPVHVVKQIFQDFTLIGELVPDYEEGEHFVSLAFQRPVH